MKTLLSLFIIFPIVLLGQDNIWKAYYQENGDFCSSGMTLFKDHVYLYETGCEGRSNINIGEWTVVEGTIVCSPIEKGTINSLLAITPTRQVKKDSKLSIAFLDKQQEALTNFNAILIPPNDDYTLDLNSSYIYDLEEHKTSVLLNSKQSDLNGKIYFSGREQYLIQEKGFRLRILSTELWGESLIIGFHNFPNQHITIQVDVHRKLFGILLFSG